MYALFIKRKTKLISMAQRCNLLVSFIVFQEASVKRSFTAGCKYLAKREIEEVS